MDSPFIVGVDKKQKNGDLPPIYTVFRARVCCPLTPAKARPETTLLDPQGG
jgi:hypothetical protein